MQDPEQHNAENNQQRRSEESDLSLRAALIRTPSLLRYEQKIRDGRLKSDDTYNLASEMQHTAEDQNWSRLLDYISFLDAHKSDIGRSRIDLILNSPRPLGLGQPLIYACYYGGPAELVEKLIRVGANTSVNGALGHSFGRSGAKDWYQPLHAAIFGSANLEQISTLLRFGADANGLDHLGRSPLQLAASINKYEIIPILLQNGADPNFVYPRTSESVLLYAFKHCCFRLDENGKLFNVKQPAGLPKEFTAERSALEELLRNGGDPFAKNSKNETLIGQFLSPHSKDVLALIAQNTDWELMRLKHPDVFPKDENESPKRILHWIVSQKTLLNSFYEDYPLEVYTATKEIFNNKLQLLHVKNYISAALSVLQTNKGQPFIDDPGITELVPHLLHSYPPGSINSLFAQIESIMDHQPSRRGMHPYEAEMMLLLNSEYIGAAGEYATPLTLSLTSINRFIDNEIYEIDSATVANLAAIGALSFSWPKWKYESLHPTESNALGQNRKLPSTFEQYGLIQPYPRDTDQVFGSSYILLPGTKPSGRPISGIQDNPEAIGGLVREIFDPETFIELRRGYFVVSNPSRGTLIIRNSSRVFGRDKLAHPAYYAPPGDSLTTSPEAILNLRREDIETDNRKRKIGFSPILQSYINDYFSSVEKFDLKLSFLIHELDLLLKDYRGWVFDTRRHSAWVKDPFGGDSLELYGGHLSPGFKLFIENASKLSQAEAKRLNDPSYALELAFVNPRLPPWLTYSFTQANGSRADRLKLTPEVTSVLLDLASSRATESRLEKSGVRNFLQQAGLNNYAELVILAPN